MNQKEFDEIRENIDSVFESIKQHDGEQFVNFVRGLIAMRHIREGINICGSTIEEIDDPRLDRIRFIHSIMIEILRQGAACFCNSAKENLDIEKAVHWANKIDENVQFSVDSQNRRNKSE